MYKRVAIFSLVAILSQSCSDRFDAPDCDDQEGIQVRNELYSNVPSDYTGIVFFCENGKVTKTEEFKNGKQDGWRKVYNKNRLWQMGEFLEGYHNGQCTYYYENGNIKESQFWIYNKDHPILRKQECWDEDGNEIKCE
jgi:antitoxin component YwqK of YwqJK toxin-antitoxin module